jgi:uncharacterized protein (TIGR02117 family)
MRDFLSRCAMVLVFCCLTVGCMGPKQALFRGQTPADIQQTSAETGKTIYVVGHGWHTGLVLKMDDVEEPLRPGFAKKTRGRYMEIGWGDEGFYRAKSIDPGVAIRAIFTPTPSVLHLVGFYPRPEKVFIGSDVIELKVTDVEFHALCEHIRESFETDENGKAKYLSPGIYGASAFYRARGSYYYPKTCNVWTACALQKAGVPMVTALSTTAGGVVSQAKLHGRSLRSSSPLAIFHALGIGKPSAE